MKHTRDWPREILRDIIREAIEEGFLFELLFMERGRRLWKGYPEHQINRMVVEELMRKRPYKKRR